jgi:cytochrome c peroxidase
MIKGYFTSPKLGKLSLMITALLLGTAGASAGGTGDADLRQSYRRPLEIPFPADNLYSPEKAELGKVLFFDPRLSGSEGLSCSSCHNASFGWEDGRVRGRGDGLKELGRNSPTALNHAWSEIFFWDGRADSLEHQAMGPITAEAEMNMPIDRAVEVLKGIGWYKKRFDSVFPGQGVSPDTITKAIATFERTIVSAWAPFDDWVDGKEDAIPESAKRGFALFNGKANCAACHSGWNFTDQSFHDIGVKSDDIGRAQLMPDIPEMMHAFKTPSLRNITQRAPYMHDGSVATLRDVVKHYTEGNFVRRPSLSAEIKSITLTDGEIEDIVTFLNSLTGQEAPVAVPVLP